MPDAILCFEMLMLEAYEDWKDRYKIIWGEG